MGTSTDGEMCDIVFKLLFNGFYIEIIYYKKHKKVYSAVYKLWYNTGNNVYI